MQFVFNKYGPSAFSFEILESGLDPLDRHAMTIVEQKWMDLLRPVYNTLAAAERRPGPWHSPETGRKIAAANKGKKASAETRAKMSASRMGNKYRVGHKPANTGKKMPPEFGIKISMSKKASGFKGPNFGKNLSAETKRKISESKRGKKMSQEFKDKLSAAFRGKPWTEARRKAHDNMMLLKRMEKTSVQ